jgi:hypothetical protein
MTMCRIGYILAYLAAAGAAPPTVSPDPKSLVISEADLTRSKELVAELGNPDFREREDAQGELAKMGRRALPALLDALETSRNPEIRARCHRLVPKAEAADLEARIQTFLADEKGKYEHDLPGQDKFDAAVKDAAARGLFAEIVRDPGNRPLLEAMDRPAGALVRAVADRKDRLYSRLYPRRLAPGMPVPKPETPTPAQLAALYLADSCIDPAEAERGPVPQRAAARTVLTNSRVRNVVREVLESDEPQDEAFKQIFIAWLATRTDPSELYSATSMVNSLRFVEGLIVAERAALAPSLQASRRAYAATALARHGGPERLPTLRKLFKEEAVAFSFRLRSEVYQVELRDIALAMCLRLTDQNPEDYGFQLRSPGDSEALRFSYTNHFFPGDSWRKTAFEKWEVWERAQKDKSGKK